MVRSVLVSDAGSYKAVVIMAFLARHYPGLRVLGCDWRAGPRLLRTRHAHFHARMRQGPQSGRPYVEELRRLCEDHAVDLLLPVSSQEMEVLVPAREAFGSRLAWLGPAEAFHALNRKDRLAALAGACGVRTPEHFPDPSRLRPPAVVKPVASSSARGVRYLMDEEAVARWRARPPAGPEVMQAWVAGEGVGYSGFAREGRILVGHGHRRLAEFPVRGGSSVYRESFHDPALAEAAARLVGAARWSGFAMFEFKRAPAGELYLLECNPRIWGSIHQGLRGGANYFEPLLGSPSVPLSPEPGVRTYLSPLLYAALAGYAARGDLRPLRAFARGLRRNRADVPFLADPRGWFGTLMRF